MTRTLPSLRTAQLPILFASLGIAGFHIAYSSTRVAQPIVFFSLLLFSYSLIRIPAAVLTPRVAFYAGLLFGMGIYAPQLGFFWTIFGPPAATLWIILAFWIGLFVSLVHCCQRQFGRGIAAALAPFLWTGLEYFRSELYYLRFAWLSPGFAFAAGLPELSSAANLGVYGIGFIVMGTASGLALLRIRSALVSAAIIILGLTAFSYFCDRPEALRERANTLKVVGVQAEFPVEFGIPGLLDQALKKHPEAELFMLSEYTFDGAVPKTVCEWCKRNQRYLVAGGKDVLSSSEFYDTAFVVGPSGEIVFKQAKSIPIQFFKDGLPAKERRLWHSPWGKLGLCICYDLSYSRVTDDLARQGAQALLVPTMDVLDWGMHEHNLHARVAPMRAAEYGIPIFRVASSGISQLVDRSGYVTSLIPFGEQEKTLSGELHLSQPAQLPWDRYLAPFSTAVAALLAAWFVIRCLWAKGRTKVSPPAKRV